MCELQKHKNNYWDLLTEDLQDLIISIRDTEKEKNILKIGYYVYRMSYKKNYYFNITKVNEKSFNLCYVMSDRNKLFYTNVGPSYNLSLNIETSLDGKNTNTYFKNYNIPIIYIKNLEPINFFSYNRMDNRMINFERKKKEAIWPMGVVDSDDE